MNEQKGLHLKGSEIGFKILVGIMGKRKRINISVDEELYRRLQRIKETYGFKNVCEFNVAALKVLCQYIEDNEVGVTSKEQSQSDKEAIIEMFSKLEGWERAEMGTVPVRYHRKMINENGKR